VLHEHLVGCYPGLQHYPAGRRALGEPRGDRVGTAHGAHPLYFMRDSGSPQGPDMAARCSKGSVRSASSRQWPR